MATDQELLQRQVEIPASTVGVYELPCGYLDKENALHTEVTVREITGAEEDMLASRAVPTNKKLNELITSCVTKVGTITDRNMISEAIMDFTVGDRVFLMFAVRRATLGDDFPFTEDCPSCGEGNLYAIDLSKLDVKKMADPKKRLHEINLPSGKKAKFRAMTGRDEAKLEKFTRSADALSMAILVRLEELNDEPATLNSVKSLGLRDRNFIRDMFDEVEGGVDTTMEMTCPSCGHDFETELDIGQSGFFFPSSTQKASKTRSSI